MRVNQLSGATALALGNGLTRLIAEQEQAAKTAGEQAKSASLSMAARNYMLEREREAFVTVKEMARLRAAAMAQHAAAMRRDGDAKAIKSAERAL